MRLTEAQIRWLNDPRPYSNPHRDRTFRALIDKGAVRVKDPDFSGSGKCGYIVTPEGMAAMASAVQQPASSSSSQEKS